MKRMNIVLSLVVTAVIVFSVFNMLTMTTRAADEDPSGIFFSDRNSDGMITISNSIIGSNIVTYCLDKDIVFYPDTNYVIQAKDVGHQVLYVLDNSYPMLTPREVKVLWDLDAEPTEYEVYHATQGAVWYFTNAAADIRSNLASDGRVTPVGLDLYDKLVAGGIAVGPGYTPDPKRFILKDASLHGLETQVDLGNGTTKHGPYQVALDGAAPLPEGLFAEIALTSTGSGLSRFGVLDENGVSVSDGIVPLNKDFYILVNAEYDGDFQVSFTLRSDGSGISLPLNYVTYAVYLESTYNDEIGTGGAASQPILLHRWTAGQPADSVAKTITNTPVALPDSADLVIEKLAGDNYPPGGGEPAPVVKVFLVKDGASIAVGDPLTPFVPGSASAFTVTFDATDIDEYFNKGYDVFVVEEWLNYSNRYIVETDYRETRLTTASGVLDGGGSFGAQRFVDVTGGDYNINSSSGTRPTAPTTDYYVGLRFDFDDMISSYASNPTVTFNNSLNKAIVPVQVMKHIDSNSDPDYVFYVFALEDGDDYIYLNKVSTGSKDVPLSLLGIMSDYDNDLSDKVFVIVEDWPNSSATAWGGVNNTTTLSGGTRYYYDLDTTIPSTPSVVGRATTLNSTYKYPGTQIILNGNLNGTSTIGVTFTNISEPVEEPTISIMKVYSGDNYLYDEGVLSDGVIQYNSAYEFEFRLFEVDGAGKYTYLKDFELKHNESVNLLDLVTAAEDMNDLLDRTFVVTEGNFKHEEKALGHNFKTSVSSARQPDGWSFTGLVESDRDTLFALASGATTASPITAGVYGQGEPECVFPAYQFTVTEDLSGEYSLEFANTASTKIAPTVMLIKDSSGGNNTDTADDHFYFNLYQVDGTEFILVESDIPAKRGETVDLTLYLSGDYYNNIYAIVEYYAYGLDDGWWHDTGAASGGSGFRRFIPFGTSAFPLFLESDTGTYGPGYVYYGVEFKLPAPTAPAPASTITFTNIDTDMVNNELQILKVDQDGDASFSGAALRAAKFDVYEYAVNDEIGDTIDDGRASVATLTHASGNTYTTTFKEFKRGEQYVIVETDTPSGVEQSVKDTIVAIVLIDPDIKTVQTETIKNERIGTVSLSKKNSKETLSLTGAKFYLYDWIDNDPGSYAAQTPLMTNGGEPMDPMIVIDDPTVTLEDLPFGEYALVEVSPPTGYIITEKVTHIIIDKDHVNPTYVIKNSEPASAKIDIELFKVETDDFNRWSRTGDAADLEGKGLSGAEFMIQFFNAELEWQNIGLMSYAGNGIYNFPDGLNANRYRIQEITAPEGYLADSGVYYYFQIAIENYTMIVKSFFKKGNVSGADPALWLSATRMAQLDGKYFVIANRDSSKPEPPTGGGTSYSTSLTVNKVWDDGNDAGRPREVQMQLYSGVISIGSPVTLNSGNSWSYTWSGLDAAASWSVREVNVPEGYNMSITGSGGSYTITNSKSNGGTPGGGGPSDADDDDDADEPDDSNDPTKPGGSGGRDSDDDSDSDSDNDSDADGDQPYTPGGNDQNGIPNPMVPGGTLIADGNGFLEIDENGVPLGRWDWDDEAETWIFDDFTPLANMISDLPQTGDAMAGTQTLYLLLGIALVGMGLLLRVRIRKRGNCG